MEKIKLTKENVKVDDEYPFYLSIWCGSEEGTKETIQQLLDDYEKSKQCSGLYHQLKRAERKIKYLKELLKDPDKRNIHIKPEDYKKILEKARKWDELTLDEEDKDITLHGAKLIKENQKLRELIEGILTLEITSTRDAEEHQLLQNLLEESKK